MTDLLFWKAVDKNGPNGCWIWTNARNPYGYGQITRRKLYNCKGKTFAHRHSWLLNRGPIPAGLYVLHKCDNPPCVNPDHLWLGTYKDNSLDRIARGRYPRELSKICGEKHFNAKLSRADVLRIRKIYVAGRESKTNQHKLADEYGMARTTIYSIVTRKIWKWL